MPAAKIGADGVLGFSGRQPACILWPCNPIFARWQVLQSFSEAEIAASEKDEAAGLPPGNEDDEAGCDFSPEKPCLSLFTDGKAPPEKAGPDAYLDSTTSIISVVGSMPSSL